MAAAIGWADSNVSNNPQKRGQRGRVAGSVVEGFVQSWTKKTTDGDGTIYFLAEIPSDALMISLLHNSDSITGLTSASYGLFKIDPSLGNLGGPNTTKANYNAGYPTSGTPSGTNAWVDASAIFMALTDINAGSAEGSERNALANLVVQTITTLGATTNGFLNYGKKVWELLGISDPKWKEDAYAIGMYVATAGSAAGNLCLRGRYIRG